METSAVLSGISINASAPFTQLSPFVAPQRIGSSFGLPCFGNLSSTSNGSRIHCMQVVNPQKNRRFETLSYVPPLNEQQIAKQVDYIISKGWIPCLEFDEKGVLFRENSRGCGYYDGRYWTMWKLPMFGCQDPASVLREIDECKNAYPNAYVRLMAFDPKRQVQVVAFVVQRPS